MLSTAQFLGVAVASNAVRGIMNLAGPDSLLVPVVSSSQGIDSARHQAYHRR